MLTSERNIQSRPLLPNASSRLSRAEKTEFTFQSLVMLVSQGLSAYYTLSDIEFLDENNMVLTTVIYTLINSAYSISNLYKLGPYKFNVSRLQDNIKEIKTRFSKLKNDREASILELNKIEKCLETYAVSQGIFLQEVKPTKHNSYFDVNLPVWKNTCQDMVTFLWNFFIGALIGKNINIIFNASDKTGYNVIAPLLTGMVNSLFQIYLFKGIEKNRFFIPSHHFMRKALQETKWMESTLEKLDENFYDKYARRMVTLQQVSENCLGLNLEEKVVAKNKIAIDIHDPAQASFQSSRWANVTYAATSLLPLMTSIISLIIAADSEKQEGKDTFSLLIPIIVVSFVSMALVAWRTSRYHGNDISGLQNYCYFMKDNYKAKLTDLGASLTSDVTKQKSLFIKFNFLSQQKIKRSEKPAAVVFEEDLFPFVCSHHFGKKLSAEAVFAPKPACVDAYAAYLQENHIGMAFESFVDFCESNPSAKSEFERLYHSHQDLNKNWIPARSTLG